MKKYLSLLVMCFILFGNGFPQQNVFKTQGIPRPDLEVKSKKNKTVVLRNDENTTSTPEFSFDEIKFWVGEGENRAALIIDWYYDGSPSLVWGYRWNGTARGEDMVRAIAAEDSRLVASIEDWGWACTLSGMGYDPNNSGNICVKSGSTTYCREENGVIPATGDGFNPVDPQICWRSGWYEGYWSYQLKDPESSEYEYAQTGFSDRWLSDGCWDAWAYQVGWDSWTGVIPRFPFTAVLPMTLDQSSTTLEAGSTLQLTPTIFQKSYQGQTITWTSSDEAIATIDENGNVTTIKEGTVTITATISETCNATCKVTITSPPILFSFDDINYWIGSGSKHTAVVIKWNDGKDDDALVWGYKWDGDKKVIDMLKDIAKADERFFVLLNETGTVNVGGIGFDLNGENTTAIVYNNNVTYPLYPFEGLVNVTTADFDKYTVFDTEDHWCAGVSQKGIWNYLVMEDGETSFSTSSESILNRTLTDESWNAWNFDTNFEGKTLGVDFIAASEYVQPDVDYTKGIFFVNEDWFGHVNSSVNFLTDDGEWIYRAYTKENPKQALGCTAQFGTIYGDNIYFVSKQAADGGDTQYTPGGRLVVADAVTLEKKANFDVLGTIGGSSGIILFNIDDLTIGNLIAGTDGGSQYAGQIGMMLRIGDYVFACRQGKGILVIDAKTHTVKQEIACTKIGTIIQSKDGYLWASAYGETSGNLWKINPYTLEVEKKIIIPTAAQIPSTWGAWTSGVMAASTKTNTLYWAKMNGTTMTFFGTKVFKYDIDNDDIESEDFLKTPFYELTGYEGKEAFYGSGLKINPETDELVITTTKTGYGAAYQKNRVHIIDGTTAAVKQIYELQDYYWFPAMSVFPDNHKPIVSNELVNLTIDEETKIYLGNKVSDSDNQDAAIIKSIISVSNSGLLSAIIHNDSLLITPTSGQYGSSDIKIQFNSNGKITSKTITVTIDEPVTPVTGITLNQTTANLTTGEELALVATVTPNNATNKTVTWLSSNTSVATVSNGTVTAVGAGTVSITATTVDGGFTATCMVTVSYPTGLDTVNGELSIYLEPSTGNIIINTTASGFATVYYISGKAVLSEKINVGENHINISRLSKGVYIVKFGTETLKFIKK